MCSSAWNQAVLTRCDAAALRCALAGFAVMQTGFHGISLAKSASPPYARGL